MKEKTCNFLQCTDGKPKGKTIPATPPVYACATCYAKKDSDCAKAKAKFRITPWCWRIKISGSDV